MHKGYTLVELLLTIGVLGILLSIGGLAFAGIRNSNSIDSVAAEIRGELMRAQTRSLNGNPAGVYFEPTRYVYFEGAAYGEGDPGNEEHALSSQMSLASITFDSSTAQFDPLTGYLQVFTDSSRVVVQSWASGPTRTISVNRWGVVDVQ